ncbi:MAG: sulfatase-like hydrolase/transferase, partial [Polyangiales bacterium]
FWGAFTPGGFTGLGGFRIYDVAKHTGKVARATAVVGVEMILGQLAFGIVVMLGSIYGLRFLGSDGVWLVNAGFLGVVLVGLAVLWQPGWLRLIASRFPAGLRPRLQSLVDATCAYQGKLPKLTWALLLGMGTHACNNLIYVCAARALGVELGVGEVFFASSLQILATLLPASINGIGLREAAAVALYTRLGVPAAVAVLIPIVGFAAEMLVSAVGGVFFALRRPDYRADIRVDEADREAAHTAHLPRAPQAAWPRLGAAWRLGAQGALLGGVLVGLGEAAWILAASTGPASWRVWLFGAAGYGALAALGGGAAGWGLAWWGRRQARAAVAPGLAQARWLWASVAGLGTALGTFLLWRDVFHQGFALKSPRGLLLFGSVAGAAALLYALGGHALQRLWRHPRMTWWLRPWATPLVSVSLVASAVGLVTATASTPSAVGGHTAHGRAPSKAAADGGIGNILFVVVDTLRADHLGIYGHPEEHAPNLRAFADDAIRFDQAFANASWTRPSFASLLSGRYPASHGVMAKADALPNSIETLPERLQQHGWQTFGVVTNFNVAPYFNFQQGFDHYRYLEPNFVLGADDASAKLLWLQFARQRIEGWRATRGLVEAGTAYQDAVVVGQAVRAGVQQAAQDERPWFAFVGYMDPHDPYFRHPYNGQGYARAAHQKPRVAEAEELRRLYLGEIRYWDKHFGTLVRWLKARQLYDDLTIVVTSDHGEEFAEHGGFWHGTTLFDEQIRVPLLLKLPRGRQAGTVVRHWVESVDVMPTLLALAGVPVPSKAQGGSLFDGRDTVYAQEDHEGNVLEAVRHHQAGREEKLITANPGNPRGLPSVSLYRVDDDPEEQDDRAQAEPEHVHAGMRVLIEAASRARQGAAARQHIDVSQDDDAQERLRLLGYLKKEDDE